MVFVEISPGKFGFRDGSLRREHLSQELESTIDTAAVGPGSITDAKLHPDLRNSLLASGVRHFDDEASMVSAGVADGTLTIVRNASHGGGEPGKKILLKSGDTFYGVANVDETPTWVTEPASNYSFSAANGNQQIALQAQDPEGLPITYAIQSSDGPLTVFVLSGDNQVNVSSTTTGTSTVVVSASDPSGNLLLKTLTITMTA